MDIVDTDRGKIRENSVTTMGCEFLKITIDKFSVLQKMCLNNKQLFDFLFFLLTTSMHLNDVIYWGKFPTILKRSF